LKTKALQAGYLENSMVKLYNKQVTPICHDDLPSHSLTRSLSARSAVFRHCLAPDEDLHDLSTLSDERGNKKLGKHSGFGKGN
jgi:hypothetical protein